MMHCKILFAQALIMQFLNNKSSCFSETDKVCWACLKKDQI